MNKYCKVCFGTYMEASEDTQTTNTMKSRTEGCIALVPSGNLQGSTMCFNLNIVVVVKRITITPLPMPDQIKNLVNRWGNQPWDRKYTGGIKFIDRNKNDFKWENEDLVETIDDVYNPIYPTLAAEILGVVLEDDHVNEGAALEETIPPTHREHADAADRN